MRLNDVMNVVGHVRQGAVLADGPQLRRVALSLVNQHRRLDGVDARCVSLPDRTDHRDGRGHAVFVAEVPGLALCGGSWLRPCQVRCR